ncbi:TonB-dependent receptor domain-containing protein [Tellurirhabdus rosea]|uniref:TonB-dependent receptor domain-containing protein n=1 Tax=Tellurirhabdus rosea TaxID=2674997 RepID=UPI0022571083|nr:TonB-dependent receptor [Tellurirhabdus rosea]
MKHPLLLLLFLACLQAQAQTPAAPAPPSVRSPVIAAGRISGTVLDAVTNKPVEFATVALLNAETGKPITGTTTDETGKFQLSNVAAGQYRIAISFMGYETRTVDPVSITVQKPEAALGVLTLKADNRTLGEVTVTAQKELIEDKEDRLVYNAEKDPTAAGGTAVDLLKKVPMLTVDPDGTIQLKGSSSIKVLINGKPSSIMARNINEALQMIPAEMIKTVEVITAPSAKYDSEGTAGVINIITKSQLQGLTGGLNAAAGNLRRNFGGNFNFKGQKLSVTGFGGVNGSNYFGGASSFRQNLRADSVVSTVEQQSTYRNTGRSFIGSFSVDYDIDTLNRVGIDASFGGEGRNTFSTRDTRTRLLNPQEFRRYNRSENGNGNMDLNFNYTRIAKRSSEQEYTFLAQYNRNDNASRYDLNQYPLPESDVINYRERNNNTNQQNELTIQTDYAYPFSTVKRRMLEVGTKAIYRDVNSDFRLENARDGSLDYQEDPRRANTFEYQQLVWATYGSFRFRTDKQWGFTFGGRFELTDINANFISTNTRFSDRYQNLMPNITLSKRLGKSQRVRLNYSQRIQRPSIAYLNPYVNYSDPKNIRSGNPYLNAELAHSVELSYNTFTQKGLTVNTTFFGRQTNNAIEQVTTVDSSGVSTSTFRNIARNATYGTNLYASVRPVKQWNLNGSVGLNYNLLNSPALQTTNQNWSYRFNLNTSLQLPKDFSLQANGSYTSRRVQLQGQSSGYYYYGFSARKEFKKQKVTFVANAENVFRLHNVVRNQFQTATFISEGINYNVIRNVRLSVNWRFGKMKAAPERERKKITNDDGKS